MLDNSIKDALGEWSKDRNHREDCEKVCVCMMSERVNKNSWRIWELSIPSDLQDLFASLPQSLQDIVGHISFPPDNGVDLLHSINENPSPHIFGASDASFKSGRASHAWILSSGSTSDISNPLRNISGGGIVHGHPSLISSGRGELHGILVLSIVANIFKMHHSSTAPVTLICNLQCVTSKCNTLSIISLCSHKSQNVDMYITQRHITTQNSITHEWVKGHSDKAPWESIKDIQEQGLNRDKIYNVWYNKLAKQYWVSNASANLEPDPTLVEK